MFCNPYRNALKSNIHHDFVASAPSCVPALFRDCRALVCSVADLLGLR